MNAISQRMDKQEKMELKIKIVKLKRYEWYSNSKLYTECYYVKNQKVIKAK
jgi:hypothetical protein